MMRWGMRAGAALGIWVLVWGAAQAATAIKDLPKSPIYTIEGEIAEVFGNYFIVSDASGRILVKTGPTWFKRHSFTPGTRLTVTGEIDDGAFDAHSIRFADGQELVIRRADGPPPWTRRGAQPGRPQMEGRGEGRGSGGRGPEQSQ